MTFSLCSEGILEILFAYTTIQAYLINWKGNSERKFPLKIEQSENKGQFNFLYQYSYPQKPKFLYHKNRFIL